MNAPNSIHCEGDYRRAEAEITRLTGIIDELSYQVDHWKREACQLIDSDRTNLIQEGFGLSAEESVVCAALYQRRDKLLPGNFLEGLLDEYRGSSSEASLVSQMVSRIRRKLGDEAIENIRGRGYRLGPALLKSFDRKLSGKK